VPLGDFWLMKKLKESISKEDFAKQPSKMELVGAAATIYR